MQGNGADNRNQGRSQSSPEHLAMISQKGGNFPAAIVAEGADRGVISRDNRGQRPRLQLALRKDALLVGTKQS